jgi:hypothetical protein
VTHATDDEFYSFRAKILYFVPVIDDFDLEDTLYLVKHRRHLAYCASYVASQFIPGSNTIRQQLAAHASEFVKGTKGPLIADSDILWSQLQALAIIYAYCPAGDVVNIPSAPASKGILNHWEVKSSVEAFALRTQLHRSIEELKLAIHENQPDISKSLAFKKYVYWLWLVTMSHHFSLISRTPPSLREDGTIAPAADLLRNISRPARVTRILAEIDLFVLWQQAGRKVPGLAEWWCKSSEPVKVEDLIVVLEDMEGAFDVWSLRWGLRGEQQATISHIDIGNNSVNFHFQATRFTINTLGTRYILERARAAASDDQESQSRLNELARQFILKSVAAAYRCTRCLVDLAPLKRERMRYMAEFGYVLLAFCCIYIIQAHEIFGEALPVLESFLLSAEETATLMTEMAVASSKAPRLYGESLLQRLSEASSSRRSNLGHVAEGLLGADLDRDSSSTSPRVQPPLPTSVLPMSLFDPDWAPVLR